MAVCMEWNVLLRARCYGILRLELTCGLRSTSALAAVLPEKVQPSTAGERHSSTLTMARESSEEEPAAKALRIVGGCCWCGGWGGRGGRGRGLRAHVHVRAWEVGMLHLA